MKPLTLEKITELQKHPANIRNICILAHVDHGKTTLADTLVASNGIISQRMAGKLRYLDSREDEQIRGITMKSSAISLVYNAGGTDTLINLIDSPGHIDFSSEVSTAVRLCDGAIVLVDVVEGICPQTHAVLRQAWLENIKPVLVLNKIDRLITELKMSPIEAHIHLQHILQMVNAITGELFTSHVLEKTSQKNEETVPAEIKPGEQVFDWSSGLEETDDSNLYFSPDQGNVIFASAIDGWGFGIKHFADLYSAKLGVNATVLEKTLWGDFYLETKTKRIKKGAQAKSKKPLFVNFILENLWSVYEAVMVKRDKEMIEKIVKSLNLKISPRDLRHSDPRVLLQALCSQWLPLSKSVLEMVVEKLPSAHTIEEERAEKLLCSRGKSFDNLPKDTQDLKQAFLSCSSDENAPVIIYVSKLFPVERKQLPQNKQRPLTQEQISERSEMARKRHAEKQAMLSEGKSEEKGEQDALNRAPEKSEMCELILSANDQKDSSEDQVFIAFARVFSGNVKKGKKLFVLGPKHDPSKFKSGDSDEFKKYVSEIVVEDLYLFMGRELESLQSISAGNIVGIGGLEEHILKSATISDTVSCPAFTDMYFEAAPIVRVAVEPQNAGDMQKLTKGLKLLNQADPSVQILIQESGEQVIIAAGEVHLQKCLDDLTDRFAKVKVNVSSPIVPFRETIIPMPKFDRRNEAIEDANPSSQLKSYRDLDKDVDETEEDDEEVLEAGLIEIQTANRLRSFTIRAVPLPSKVAELLDENSEMIKLLDQYLTQKVSSDKEESHKSLNKQVKEDILEFKANLASAFTNCNNNDSEEVDHESEFWLNAIDQIWCFGPRKVGPNILLNRIPDYPRPSVWSCLEDDQSMCNFKEYDYCLASGFQMATLAGPLCEESMYGVCFVIESWEEHNESCSLKDRKKENKEKNKKQNTSILIDSNGTNPELDTSVSDGDFKSKLSAENISCDIPNCDISSPSSPDLGSASPLESPCGIDQVAMFRNPYGPLSGQLMSAVRQGCRRAFQSQPQRLMWAMYTCVIQAEAEILGKMYGVLSKRHGRIIDEDMKQGTSVFNIDAVLPVVESFGFAEEIRKKTSGLASPQLKFSHWEIIELDPFWVPTTEEEYMHFGEKADSANVARKYMNNIRNRKGLHTDEKLVEFGTKQRTLKKNK